ncbi:MAG: phage baseplate protein, partial [Acidobacteria bacterium]|nr:phage baseplate protein [Acidobacteriota bacterium]
MNVSGSTVDFPIRVDARGTIVTTARREDVIEQAIGDIIETRRGERVMLPDYGIDDYVFASVDAAFAH